MEKVKFDRMELEGKDVILFFEVVGENFGIYVKTKMNRNSILNNFTMNNKKVKIEIDFQDLLEAVTPEIKKMLEV
jgi:hypothetical protein